MTHVTFRKATIADLPAIVALLADDILGQQREDSSVPPAQVYVDAFNAIDADPNQLQVVAVNGEEVIGTLQLTFTPGLARKGAWRGQIEGVRISRHHRSAGIGELMFAWAIEVCKDKGCKWVQLTTYKQRPDAHRFYDKLGFVDSHIGYKLAL